LNLGFDAKRAFHNATGLGSYSRLLIRSLQRYRPDHGYFLYSPRAARWDAGNSEVRTPYGPMALFPSLWRSVGIARDFRRVGLDIYHGLSNELPLELGSSRVKKVVTIHDLIFLRYPGYYSPVDRRTYLWKSRHACRHADLVVAVSEQTKRDLVERLGVPEDRVRVLYQGYEPIFDRPLDEEARRLLALKYDLPPRYLLQVGTIEERKNLLTTVKALRRLEDPIPLVVVGKKKPYYRQVAEYLDREGLAERVRFLGPVGAEDLPGLYQGAEVFLYPSIFEGFGIPIIEALASGVPVIAAKGSCLEEAGGPGSVYVDPQNDEELAQEIEKLLSSSSRRAESAGAGRAHVSRFQADRLAVELERLYESL
jgi:glycosyltransferase involved in cell wall biosynthesis